jgi:hypothetical protein
LPRVTEDESGAQLHPHGATYFQIGYVNRAEVRQAIRERPYATVQTCGCFFQIRKARVLWQIRKAHRVSPVACVSTVPNIERNADRGRPISPDRKAAFGAVESDPPSIVAGSTQ